MKSKNTLADPTQLLADGMAAKGRGDTAGGEALLLEAAEAYRIGAKAFSEASELAPDGSAFHAQSKLSERQFTIGQAKSLFEAKEYTEAWLIYRDLVTPDEPDPKLHHAKGHAQLQAARLVNPELGDEYIHGARMSFARAVRASILQEEKTGMEDPNKARYIKELDIDLQAALKMIEEPTKVASSPVPKKSAPPTPPEKLFADGMVEKERGNSAESKALLLGAAELYGKAAGTLAAAEPFTSDAYQETNRAYQRQFLLGQASSYLEAGEFAKAWPLYNELVKPDEPNPLLHYEKGLVRQELAFDAESKDLYRSTRRHQEARDSFAIAAEKDPSERIYKAALDEENAILAEVPNVKPSRNTSSNPDLIPKQKFSIADAKLHLEVGMIVKSEGLTEEGNAQLLVAAGIYGQAEKTMKDFSAIAHYTSDDSYQALGVHYQQSQHSFGLGQARSLLEAGQTTEAWLLYKNLVPESDTNPTLQQEKERARKGTAEAIQPVEATQSVDEASHAQFLTSNPTPRTQQLQKTLAETTPTLWNRSKRQGLHTQLGTQYLEEARTFHAKNGAADTELLQGAMTQFQHALDLGPKNKFLQLFTPQTDTHMKMATTSMDLLSDALTTRDPSATKKYAEKAVTHFTQVERFTPKGSLSADASTLKGNAHFHLHDHKNAEAYYTQALVQQKKTGTGDAVLIQANRAFARGQLGDYAGARTDAEQAYEQIAKNDSPHSTQREKLATLLLKVSLAENSSAVPEPTSRFGDKLKAAFGRITQRFTERNVRTAMTSRPSGNERESGELSIISLDVQSSENSPSSPSAADAMNSQRSSSPSEEESRGFLHPSTPLPHKKPLTPNISFSSLSEDDRSALKGLQRSIPSSNISSSSDSAADSRSASPVPEATTPEHARKAPLTKSPRVSTEEIDKFHNSFVKKEAARNQFGRHREPKPGETGPSR